MVIPKINSAHGSDTRNIINRAIDLINVQGKSIQDLVAKGQLTPAQYEQLLYSVNSLLKNGDVDKYALSESLRKELEAIKDASPKGVYENLTELRNAYPNGADGIYVVSDNGNWYFWNGSIWESGGVYQSTGLSDYVINTVADVAKTKNVEYQALEKVHATKINKAGDVKNGNHINPDGEMVVRGELTYPNNIDSIFSEKEIPKIMRFQRNIGETSFAYFTKAINTERHYTYGFWIRKSDITKLSSGSRFNYQVGMRDPSLNTIYSNISVSLEQALTLGTELSASIGTGSFAFKTEKEFKGWMYYTIKSIEVDSSQRRISLNVRLLDLDDGERGKLDILNFTTLEGSEILPFFVYPVSEYEVIKSLYPEQNILSGKVAVFDGDSIAHGGSAQDNLSGWAGRIGKKNNMIWENYAVSGGTITAELYTNAGAARHWISRNVINLRVDADYIIFEGGTNDADLLRAENNIGEISSGYNAVLDDTTFSGALESTFKQAILKFPGKKIGFIVAHKMGPYGNSMTNNRRDYFDRAIEICKKWGIPYIDLWETSYLNPSVTEIKDQYYTDGQHLKSSGYDVITSKIEAWMKTL